MDFSLGKLRELLVDIRDSGYTVTPFVDYWNSREEFDRTEHLVLLRHDVDRFPGTALEVAKLENELGMKGTYFFRTRSHVLDAKIIQSIADLGHEIGYHYECLADAKGNYERAIELCRADLTRLRSLAPIHSASMHSRPFSPHDGRTLWDRFQLSDFGLLGESYRSIDHDRFIYLADSGRNWGGKRNVVWDSVIGLPVPEISGTDELRRLFTSKSLGKVQLLIHPNRWPKTNLGWIFQWASDRAINSAKTAIKAVRR